MKYYISCAETDHGRIKQICDVLTSKGHTCVYEWWSDDTRSGKEDFEIAFNRVQAVENSELFLCLLPTTRTTAIEFGTALANRCGKRIILWSDQSELFEQRYVNTYFMHPSVTRMACSFNELAEYLKTL